VSALEQVLREVVATALPRAKEESNETAWVQMLAELSASFPALVFGSASSSEASAFFADALLPWVTSWVSSEARDAAFTPVLFELVHHYLQHIATADDNALLHGKWESLVREVISTGKPHLLLLLLQKACCDVANEKWATTQLDEHATHLFNALQAGATGDSELALLRFLIAGKDSRASPLLSASCLTQIIDSVSASLNGFLDGHSLAAAGLEASETDEQELASFKDVLALVRSLASSRLPAGLQPARASLLGNTVFRFHLLVQLSPPAAAAAFTDLNSTALSSLSAYATSCLGEESPETAANFRAFLISSLHDAVLHVAPTSIAGNICCAVLCALFAL
jgi:hypothetical protein